MNSVDRADSSYPPMSQMYTDNARCTTALHIQMVRVVRSAWRSVQPLLMKACGTSLRGVLLYYRDY